MVDYGTRETAATTDLLAPTDTNGSGSGSGGSGSGTDRPNPVTYAIAWLRDLDLSARTDELQTIAQFGILLVLIIGEVI